MTILLILDESDDSGKGDSFLGVLPGLLTELTQKVTELRVAGRPGLRKTPEESDSWRHPEVIPAESD